RRPREDRLAGLRRGSRPRSRRGAPPREADPRASSRTTPARSTRRTTTPASSILPEGRVAKGDEWGAEPEKPPPPPGPPRAKIAEVSTASSGAARRGLAPALPPRKRASPSC